VYLVDLLTNDRVDSLDDRLEICAAAIEAVDTHRHQ
jgi:hypothetical protein